MATVTELLEQRAEALGQLVEQIREEVSGNADLGRLSQLADELSAQGDDFASSINQAQEMLAGGQEGGGQESEGAAEGGAEDGGDEETGGEGEE